MKKALVLMFMIFSFGFSQETISSQHFVRWSANRYAYLPEDLDSFKPTIILKRANKLIEMKIPHPPSNDEFVGNGYEFCDDTLFFSRGKTIHGQHGKSFYAELIRYNENNKKWEPFASVVASGVLYLFPLNETTVVGLAMAPGVIQSGSKSYLFGIYKINEKSEARLINVYDAGLEKPFFDNGKCNYSWVRNNFIKLDRVATDTHFTFFHRAGLFWIFSKNDAKFRRFKTIGRISEKEIESGKLLEIITCVQPTRDDDYVFSARDFEMATEGYKNMGRSPNQITNENRKLDVPAYHKMLRKMYPGIFWYSMDPGSGKLEEISAPVGAPTEVVSDAEVFNFNWKIDHNNKIIFYDFKEQLGDKVKTLR